MTNLTTTHERSDQRFTQMGVRAALLALALMFTQIAQAVPIMVDVYGAPYFTLTGRHSKDGADHQWLVLGSMQGLHMSLDDNQFNLLGQHDLSVRDQSGQSLQFSVMNMSVNLPETHAIDHGVVDYLIGDRAGQFTVEQVIYRTPKGNDESDLSLFFWGIDYAHGVGMVLGLKTTSQLENHNAASQVSEPSMALLMLIGLSVYWCSGQIRRRTSALQPVPDTVKKL